MKALSNVGVYLEAPRYELGENVRDVAALEELPADARTMLLEFGLSKYRTTEREPLDLAVAPVRETLRAAALAPASIDTVVIATNSFGDASYYGHVRLARWLAELELEHAYPIGVTFSYCGNIHTALRVIGALLRCGEAETVLLVCADRVSRGETRIVPPAISVSSDGAASCVVRARPSPGAYELLGVAQVCDPHLAPEHADGRFLRYMKGVGLGVKRGFELVLGEAKLSARELSVLIPNNYNTWVTGNIARVLGIERARVFADNIGRIAHVNTADNLINLRDWEEANREPSAANVLMLGTGPNMWGLSVLRRCAG